VILFTNTAALVAEELRRKRRRPQRVYFSPSSDAFQYLPDVQQVSYDTMQVLLDVGVEVAFLTKGFVSSLFLELFAKHAHLVYAQIGLTSLDREIWRHLEPRTAPPLHRVQSMKSLVSIGCHTTARLDPLIPDMTDTSPGIDSLLETIAGSGVTFAAASYMFLRPAFGKAVSSTLKALHSDLRPDEWAYQEFTDGCSGGQAIGEQERRERFARLAEIGRRYGMTISPCRCKNPGLADGSCHIAGSPQQDVSIPVQPDLPFA
jgi:DNA repair photolyase